MKTQTLLSVKCCHSNQVTQNPWPPFGLNHQRSFALSLADTKQHTFIFDFWCVCVCVVSGRTFLSAGAAIKFKVPLKILIAQILVHKSLFLFVPF